MDVIIGVGLIAVAGLLQGSFILPMTLTINWKWEHTWALFSFSGMLVMNWAIGLCIMPHLVSAISETPRSVVYSLLFFGLCWGGGAILFGLGMDKLGMAVGYPIIMGIILSLGSLIPLAQLGFKSFVSKSGLLLLAGNIVVVGGILLISRALKKKNSGTGLSHSSSTPVAIIIAVSAGILSCFPNIGLSNATPLADSVSRLGTSSHMAGNAAWVLQFTAGFAINFIYCVFLIIRHRNGTQLRSNLMRNFTLAVAMGSMWIGSFYLYGIGAAYVGHLGTVIGWPLFISLSVLTGNCWGLLRGEWASASPDARTYLSRGMIVVMSAIVFFVLGGALR